MTNLLPTIVPKSDQLNADDLIGGPLTIKVSKVALLGDADQPVAVHYEGGDGRPYKPCKSMRRVMVQLWGDNGNAFVGQRMTLYRDDRVTFGKDAVGGIRISHMSGIERERTLALMVTRGQRKPYTVKPLPAEKAAAPANGNQAAGVGTALTLDQRATAFMTRVGSAPDVVKLGAIKNAAAGLLADLAQGDPELLAECTQTFDAKKLTLEKADGIINADEAAETFDGGGGEADLPPPETSSAPDPGVGQGGAGETPRETPPPSTQSGLSLADRIADFKGRVRGATTTVKLTSMWNASAALRNDVDRADPDEVGTSQDLEAFWQGCFDVVEQAEREAG